MVSSYHLQRLPCQIFLAAAVYESLKPSLQERNESILAWEAQGFNSRRLETDKQNSSPPRLRGGEGQGEGATLPEPSPLALSRKAGEGENGSSPFGDIAQLASPEGKGFQPSPEATVVKR